MEVQNKRIEQEKRLGVLLPCCCFCRQVPEEGICGGIKLKKGFLCNRCEREIISVEPGSSNYQDVLDKIKNLLK